MNREINLTNRNCPICEGFNIDIIWNSESIVKRSKHSWKFPYKISICKNCGFCYNSPGPDKTDLLEYHSEGFSGYKKIGLPYSTQKRVQILKKYSMPKGTYAEIGGDAPHEFHKELKKIYKKQIAIDISDDIPSEYKDVKNIENNSIDVVAHYDVLEHVLDIEDFLGSCYRILKKDGIMVCEVPNIRLYPKNLLILEFEHVNHFSVDTLSSIAGKIGFQLVELNFDCSRPHGFLSVFRKYEKNHLISFDKKNEYLKSLACINGGVEQVKKLEQQITETEVKINSLNKSNRQVIIWGVTDILRRLIARCNVSENIRVIDADPRRKDHLLDSGFKVLEPINSLEHIQKSDLLVICAARYKKEILEWVLINTKKSYSKDNVIILGENTKGELLT